MCNHIFLNEPTTIFVKVPKVQNDYVRQFNDMRSLIPQKWTYKFNEIGSQNQLKFLLNRSILR